jgi:hypothetical protein
VTRPYLDLDRSLTGVGSKRLDGGRLEGGGWRREVEVEAEVEGKVGG